MLTPRERNILVATRIAVILGVLAFTLLIILISIFGPNINSPIIFGVGVFFFLIVVINKRGYVNEGRILLCFVPPVLTLFAAVLAKIYEPNHTDILYYDARFFLILFTVVPCLIFDTSEKLPLYACLGIVFLCLILFDPVHEYFGVGYFQVGFKTRSYYYINYAAVITFLGIAAGAISLKVVIENAEARNERYKKELMDTNIRLSAALTNVEAQNEEIVQQSEELYASQEQLLAANELIEKQKSVLQQQVAQMNSDLQEANEELIKHNNELQQFSFTISHNLRGPIARLLGLAYLAKATTRFEKSEDAVTIINHIETSAVELDMVIRDLSSIVEIRNTLYQLRHPVDFHHEWTEIKRILNISEETEKKNFEIDFSEAPTMFTVRPMIHSILLNLVSNAIKFRAPERDMKIQIRTTQNDTYTILQVSDNGLGIDLSLFQHDLFKLYKRFHPHQEGRGLGLYLIKSQAESLNGFVEVQSELGVGTSFKVHIRNFSDEA